MPEDIVFFYPPAQGNRMLFSSRQRLHRLFQVDSGGITRPVSVGILWSHSSALACKGITLALLVLVQFGSIRISDVSS